MSINIHPISSAIREKLFANVFAKSSKMLHVSIMSFKGSGKPYELKYLLATEPTLLKDSHVYIWMDLRSVEKTGSLTAAVTIYTSEGSTKISDAISSLETFENYVTDTYLQKAIAVTFVFQGMYLLLDGLSDSAFYISIVSRLLRLNLENVSGIFLIDYEISANAGSLLGDLHQYVVHDVYWGGDILFDRESAEYMFADPQLVGVSKDFKDQICSFTQGDPTTLKHFIMRMLADESLEKSFLQGNASERYQLFDSYWLNNYYSTLLSTLSSESIAYLKGTVDVPTEFLNNTGLVQKMSLTESRYGLLNDLFAMWVEKNIASYRADAVVASIAQSSKTSSDFSKLYNELTAQETLFFDFLLRHKTELVTKDAIAKTIWGDAWEEQYSDWALDKLVSNIRKKIMDADVNLTLKSSKGKGVVLV